MVASGQAPAKRAVVVDDDAAMLRLLTLWLAGAGYDVESFDAFEPAHERATAAPPDLLITDVRLGAFNGLQLVVLARLAHPDLCAIVLTGFDDPVLRKDAEVAGAIFLPKPIRSEELLAVIEGAGPAKN